MKKKILALCLVVVLSITAVTGATLAYFTDFDQNTNEFTIGKTGFKIDLWEDVKHTDGAGTELAADPDLGKGDDSNPGFEYKEIMPGDTMQKIAHVENTGEQDAYIALVIKQNNTNTFHTYIDDRFEKMNAADKALGLGEDKDEVMSTVTDAIFSGTGWGLEYTKEESHPLRYMMTESTGESKGGATVLGYGYANYNPDNKVRNYAGEYFKNVKSVAGEMDGNFDTLVPDEGDDGHVRMWVIYLKVPVGGSYIVDLTTTCPDFIDMDSLNAFQNMDLDIKAFAIQSYGFANTEEGQKEAFNTLFEAENCFAY